MATSGEACRAPGPNAVRCPMLHAARRCGHGGADFMPSEGLKWGRKRQQPPHPAAPGTGHAMSRARGTTACASCCSLEPPLAAHDARPDCQLPCGQEVATHLSMGLPPVISSGYRLHVIQALV